jgi:hypothetical protein
MNCKWITFELVKNNILEYLRNENKLHSPLSIKDFVFDRLVQSSIEEHLLLKRIDHHSRVVADKFAQDISNMNVDKILFLSFPLILYTFDNKFIERKYDELCKWLKNEFGILILGSFAESKAWFKADKIDVRNYELGFSHPSYLESVHYILSYHGTDQKKRSYKENYFDCAFQYIN